MTIEELISKLSGPTFVWRMARADRETEGARRGAATRREDAEIQIDRAVLAYAADRIEAWLMETVAVSARLHRPVSSGDVLEWLRAPTLPELERVKITD